MFCGLRWKLRRKTRHSISTLSLRARLLLGRRFSFISNCSAEDFVTRERPLDAAAYELDCLLLEDFFFLPTDLVKTNHEWTPWPTSPSLRDDDNGEENFSVNDAQTHRFLILDALEGQEGHTKKAEKSGDSVSIRASTALHSHPITPTDVQMVLDASSSYGLSSTNGLSSTHESTSNVRASTVSTHRLSKQRKSTRARRLDNVWKLNSIHVLSPIPELSSLIEASITPKLSITNENGIKHELSITLGSCSTPESTITPKLSTTPGRGCGIWSPGLLGESDALRLGELRNACNSNMEDAEEWRREWLAENAMNANVVLEYGDEPIYFGEARVTSGTWGLVQGARPASRVII